MKLLPKAVVCTNARAMGSTSSRGSQMEYLELLKGRIPADKENLFEGINTTWTRVTGGAPIGKILQKVEDDFDYENPGKSVPKLMEAYAMIKKLPDGLLEKGETGRNKRSDQILYGTLCGSHG